MRQLGLLVSLLILLSACWQSDEEVKRLSAQEKARLKTEDSLALKVGVTPTLDCLPLFVAKGARLFDTLGVDCRLHYFTAQMDCDTALAGGSVEGSVSDLVRAMKLQGEGTRLTYPIATNLYWLLITNHNARLKQLKQLNDKMFASTRFSATDFFSDYALDSVKLKHDFVYRPQINDVSIRLNMILNNEMDAMLLPEPQSTAARRAGHLVLWNTGNTNVKLGIFAFRADDFKDKRRKQQLKVFLQAYDRAVDSINKNGIAHYSALIQRYCKVQKNVADSLPRIKFTHAFTPRTRDVEIARNWLTKRGITATYRPAPPPPKGKTDVKRPKGKK